jgi:hypothetical protein
MLFPISTDPCQATLASGANELLLSVTSIRHVLRWVAQLPEGVRHELLRREIAELETARKRLVV